MLAKTSVFFVCAKSTCRGCCCTAQEHCCGQVKVNRGVTCWIYRAGNTDNVIFKFGYFYSSLDISTLAQILIVTYLIAVHGVMVLLATIAILLSLRAG